MNNWSLYLLTNTDNNKTYLGVTVDINRRIKQHNGILSGGAKYTTSNIGKGEWILHAIVNNLDKSKALSYERIIKNKRRKGRGKTPLERRIYLMNLVVKDHNIEFSNIENIEE